MILVHFVTCTNFFAVTNQDKSLLDQTPSGSEPPSLKGYLSKYTNVARGYNTRWFVLKNGILSCKSVLNKGDVHA